MSTRLKYLEFCLPTQWQWKRNGTQECKVRKVEGLRPLSFLHHFLDHSETIDWMSIVEANCVIHWIEVFPAVTFWTTGEVKEHVYVKQQTQICNSWPSFPFTCRLLFIISTHKLEVSRNFLSIRIVLSCFYLLIFYFQKLSTWIWHLPFAVYVKLNFSIKYRVLVW